MIKKKFIWFIMMFTLVTSLFQMENYRVFAEEDVNKTNNSLTFNLTREWMRDVEPLPQSTYHNYWAFQPDNDVYDKSKGEMRDFTVNFKLHIDGRRDTVVSSMNYTAVDHEWHGIAKFENISIPSDKVEVEYYSPKGNQYVEPYLLNYDLYLKKVGDKMILSIPRLSPDSGYVNSTGQEVLEVKKLQIKKTNSIVYLDGKNGNDANDGFSKDKAVRTFNKAKEIASANNIITQISVIGTTPIYDNISLVGTNAEIVRGEGFSGYLFTVDEGKTASCSNITIDGKSDENKNIENSLIRVNKNATLNINDGTVLKNNQIKPIENTITEGGAINAYYAFINMRGGSVQGNQATYGGGIYLYKSTMNFTGGSVEKNKSVLVRDYSVSPTQYYSAGGGIAANGGSIINMSDNAKVLNNYAGEIGGGISLGTNQWGNGNILNMNGGIIDGNTAGASGGGIFVQAKYFSGGVSKAYINAGKITNNIMDATGVTEKMFGGGGIYVNGANNNYGVNGANGELHLKNVVITDNESRYQGAGYASCPISKTKIFISNGSAIYANKTSSEGRELFILCNKYLGLHGGSPEYELAERMLGGGGGMYKWKKTDGSFLEKEKYKGTLDKNNEYLALYTDSVANEMTNDYAKVFITGNKSFTRGGGIGSNGTVIIGTDKTTEVSVVKKWNDDKDGERPSSVKVNLIANGKYIIDTAQLSESNSWKATFKNLPIEVGDKAVTYTVEEEDVKGYTAVVSGNAEEGFTITNKKNTPEYTKVSVLKKWDDSNNTDGKRPESIRVKLMANGDYTGKSVVLNEKNGWKFTFENLSMKDEKGEIKYTVEEEDVKGYTSVVRGNSETGFTIINIRKPTIPHTGDNSRSHIYLYIIGLLCFMGTFTVRRFIVERDKDL